MENMKYKVVGTINYFDLVPCGVYVVYEGEDKKLYTGWSSVVDSKSPYDKEYLFTEFSRLGPNDLKKVRYLDQTNNTLDNIQDSYEIGNLFVCGYETEDTVYIGRLDSYVEFIKNYRNSYDRPDLTDIEENIKKELDYAIEYTELLIAEAIVDGNIKPNKK